MTASMSPSIDHSRSQMQNPSLSKTHHSRCAHVCWQWWLCENGLKIKLQSIPIILAHHAIDTLVDPPPSCRYTEPSALR